MGINIKRKIKSWKYINDSPSQKSRMRKGTRRSLLDGNQQSRIVKCVDETDSLCNGCRIQRITNQRRSRHEMKKISSCLANSFRVPAFQSESLHEIHFCDIRCMRFFFIFPWNWIATINDMVSDWNFIEQNNYTWGKVLPSPSGV